MFILQEIPSAGASMAFLLMAFALLAVMATVGVLIYLILRKR